MKTKNAAISIIALMIVACGKPNKRADGKFLNYNINCDQELSQECAEKILSQGDLYKTRALRHMDDITEGHLFFLNSESLKGQLSGDVISANNKIMAISNNDKSKNKDCDEEINDKNISFRLDEIYARPDFILGGAGEEKYSQKGVQSISGHANIKNGVVNNCELETREEEFIPNLMDIIKKDNLKSFNDRPYYASELELTGKIYATVSHEDSHTFFRFMTINFFYQRMDRKQKQFINLQLRYIGVKLGTPYIILKDVLPSLIGNSNIQKVAMNTLYGSRVKSYYYSKQSIQGKWIPASGTIENDGNSKALSSAELEKLGDFSVDKMSINIPLEHSPIKLKHYRYNEYLGPLTIAMVEQFATEKTNFDIRNLFDHRYTNRMVVSMQIDPKFLGLSSSDDRAVVNIEYIKDVTLTLPKAL